MGSISLIFAKSSFLFYDKLHKIFNIKICPYAGHLKTQGESDSTMLEKHLKKVLDYFWQLSIVIWTILA